ncbi:Uncharacterised protein [Mycobacteroides abscessus subsp. abscessus]|nr:Uncharacterised protein [Mycobacteroides abscessus subsp. abscessus]SIK58150.1 Uncharacterised protein [Mycobacteroides abscessus subsp. abscessus]
MAGLIVMAAAIDTGITNAANRADSTRRAFTRTLIWGSIRFI